MKCKRTPIVADVYEYTIDSHLEDGWEPLSDVVTKGWIVTDRLYRVTRDSGLVVVPYITHKRGRTFIEEGDYVIIDADGTKHVCGADKIFKRYEKIED
ncbi:MAG: hypothetical protein K5649_00975 [Lachnospiraceae bacterium]|nr:hypothetical protein [Lachnospiraceae bacterium]